MGWNTSTLNAIHAAAPMVATELGSKVATTTDWDSDATAEFTLPVGTQYLDVSVSDETMLLPNDTADDPTSDCCAYSQARSHRIDAKDASYLHYKSVGANGRIRVTAWGN